MAEMSEDEVELVMNGIVRLPEIGEDVIIQPGQPIRFMDTGKPVFYQSPHMPNPAMDIQAKSFNTFPEITQGYLREEIMRIKDLQTKEQVLSRVEQLVEEARRQGKEEGWNEGLATGRALDGVELPLPMNPYLPPIDDGDEYVLDENGMPVLRLQPLDGTRPTDDPDDDGDDGMWRYVMGTTR